MVKYNILLSADERAVTASFTGHRTYMGESDEELRSMVSYLYERGFRRFLCGMSWGFDLAAGRVVAELRGCGKDVELVVVEPFEQFRKLFSGDDATLYDTLLAVASKRIVVSAKEGAEAYMRRNDFLVDNASVVVAWWDRRPRSGTAYTVKRARHYAVEVVNLYPDAQLELEF